jgi:hypothetical protein
VAAPNQTLVHEYGIGAPVRHLIHGDAHVGKPVNRPDRHPVIHGNNNGTAGMPVEETLHANLFAKMHRSPPVLCATVPGSKKKAAGGLPAALMSDMATLSAFVPHQSTGLTKPVKTEPKRNGCKNGVGKGN